MASLIACLDLPDGRHWIWVVGVEKLMNWVLETSSKGSFSDAYAMHINKLSQLPFSRSQLKQSIKHLSVIDLLTKVIEHGGINSNYSCYSRENQAQNLFKNAVCEFCSLFYLRKFFCSWTYRRFLERIRKPHLDYIYIYIWFQRILFFSRGNHSF